MRRWYRYRYRSRQRIPTHSSYSQVLQSESCHIKHGTRVSCLNYSLRTGSSKVDHLMLPPEKRLGVALAADERTSVWDECLSLRRDGFILPTRKTGRQTTSRCSPSA